ncbi:MAG: hypothetical protein JOY61_19840 [Chloroflexi bacterium]|nr:hypothetical protein [Chloroflexota bacterium]
MGNVPGFLPSTSGLHFPNYFPVEPAVQVPLPDGRLLGLGDAANGLCGGMAFTTRDYFEAGRPPPDDTSAPAEGSPLFEFLVSRLMSSFNLPLGIMRYVELMTPLLPDGGPLPVTRARVMIQREWPTVQQELDSGHPSPLGLIKVKSLDVKDIGKNHQVLAYGYTLDGSRLSLSIYDPNFPNRDDITLALDIGSTAATVPVTYSTGEDVFCFFHTPYNPPAAALP